METSPNAIPPSEPGNNATKKAAVIKWLKKLGFWGFLFFLVKGLVWLALGYWVLK